MYNELLFKIFLSEIHCIITFHRQKKSGRTEEVYIEKVQMQSGWMVTLKEINYRTILCFLNDRGK